MEHEQLGYKGLSVLSDPAVTDVQTGLSLGGGVGGGDDYQCVCVLAIACVTVINISKGQTDARRPRSPASVYVSMSVA